MAKLSPDKLRALHAALLDAFRTRGAVVKLARMGLDVELNHITTSENLSDVVFEIIQWTEGRDQLQMLVEAARKENPYNEALERVAAEIIPASVTLHEQRRLHQSPPSKPGSAHSRMWWYLSLSSSIVLISLVALFYLQRPKCPLNLTVSVLNIEFIQATESVVVTLNVSNNGGRTVTLSELWLTLLHNSEDELHDSFEAMKNPQGMPFQLPAGSVQTFTIVEKLSAATKYNLRGDHYVRSGDYGLDKYFILGARLVAIDNEGSPEDLFQFRVAKVGWNGKTISGFRKVEKPTVLSGKTCM